MGRWKGKGVQEDDGLTRLVPILKDHVHGLFDRGVTGKIVFITMDSTRISRILLEIVESFVKSDGLEGVLLSYDRPSSYIFAVLKNFWVPTDRISFIDGASRLGGVGYELPEDIFGRPRGYHVKDPFDPTDVLRSVNNALDDMEAEDDPGPEHDDRRTLEDRILDNELALLGIGGSETSIMRYRLRQRLFDRGNIHIPGIGAGPVDLEARPDVLEKGRFLLIENLAAILCYMDHRAIDKMMAGLRSLIKGGRLRSVIVLIDKAQYHWIVEALRTVPDALYDLVAFEHMGVLAYKFESMGCRDEDEGA